MLGRIVSRVSLTLLVYGTVVLKQLNISTDVLFNHNHADILSSHALVCVVFIQTLYSIGSHKPLFVETISLFLSTSLHYSLYMPVPEEIKMFPFPK